MPWRISTSSGQLTSRACRKPSLIHPWCAPGYNHPDASGDRTQKFEAKSGKVEVDLFALRQTSHYPPRTVDETDALCFPFPLFYPSSYRERHERLIVLLIALDMICSNDLTDISATHLANFSALRSNVAGRIKCYNTLIIFSSPFLI